MKYDEVIPSDTAVYLNVCLNEDGDLAEYLGITPYIKATNQLLDEYNEMSTYNYNITHLTHIVSLEVNRDKLESDSSTFVGVASDVGVPKASKPENVLEDLNSWSNFDYPDSNQVMFT